MAAMFDFLFVMLGCVFVGGTALYAAACDAL
jgi:hypothetical protein